MKVILFGSSGMVGQGVLRECLLDPQVSQVLSIVRTPLGQNHPKLSEIVHEDFLNYSDLSDSILDYDACFFCLGTSSAGMKEDRYRLITYDFTLAAAKALANKSPKMTFIYVSGSGSDSSEKGRIMWARVKGATENALLRLPFKAVYLFRPGYIQPMNGIKSKTKLYGVIYAAIGPFYPIFKTIFPKWVTTTENVGRAMIEVAKNGASLKFLENRDINEVLIHSHDGV